MASLEELEAKFSGLPRKNTAQFLAELHRGQDRGQEQHSDVQGWL